jgi:hypothetical protein
MRSMVYPYVVTLRKESERPVDLVSFICCLITLLACVWAQVRSGQIIAFCLVAALVQLSGLLLQFASLLRGAQHLRFRFWLFLAGITWIGLPFLPWLSLLFFVLALMEYQAKRPLELGFSAEGIVINRLFRKKFRWSELSRVMLRDGMLTLDFKNNRIFQRESLEEDDPEAEEEEFNDFCRQQLEKPGLSPG